ncbi:MAG: hypothetical protein CL608_23760 [Anaerolineaceae bacterium]|nr:hypothetical protein [Anaerolineaceae bacterium]
MLHPVLLSVRLIFLVFSVALGHQQAVAKGSTKAGRTVTKLAKAKRNEVDWPELTVYRQQIGVNRQQKHN